MSEHEEFNTPESKVVRNFLRQKLIEYANFAGTTYQDKSGSESAMVMCYDLVSCSTSMCVSIMASHLMLSNYSEEEFTKKMGEFTRIMGSMFTEYITETGKDTYTLIKKVQKMKEKANG